MSNLKNNCNEHPARELKNNYAKHPERSVPGFEDELTKQTARVVEGRAHGQAASCLTPIGASFDCGGQLVINHIHVSRAASAQDAHLKRFSLLSY